MPEDQNVPGTNESDAKANENNAEINESDAKVNEENKKSNGAISHYKEELGKTRNVVSDLQSQNEKLIKDLETQKTSKLEEQSNYKELWENAERKRQEAEEKSNKIQTQYVSDLKRSAIEKEAIKLGINKSALNDINLLKGEMDNFVQIETTSTGNINVLGSSEFVENLKETRPHWFTDGKAPTFNNAIPQHTTNKEMTPSDILALQKKDPTKYNEIMRKRLNII